MPEEEYELVPLSPIRRIEKRMERIEKAGTGTDMVRELIDVVKTNQQIVDDVVRINSEMIKRVSELSDSVTRVTNKIDEFISRIETSAPASEPPKEQSVELQAKLEKLEKRINTVITAAAASQRRPMATARPPLSSASRSPLLARRPVAPRV